MSYLNKIFSSFGSKSLKSRDIPPSKTNKSQASGQYMHKPVRKLISLTESSDEVNAHQTFEGPKTRNLEAKKRHDLQDRLRMAKDNGMTLFMNESR